MRKSFTALVALGLSSLTLVAAPAYAESQMRIDYVAADLESPDRVASLYTQIAAAARAVCEDERRNSHYGVYMNTAKTAACARETLAAAVAHSGAPALIAHHQAQQDEATFSVAAAR